MKVGQRISARLADTEAARLRRQALADFLSGWRTRHGKITPAELARARAELGYRGAKRR